MISCDRDFETIHFNWLAQGKQHAGIIFMHAEHHCKHISEIVRIITFYNNLADDENDLAGEIWQGEDAQ